MKSLNNTQDLTHFTRNGSHCFHMTGDCLIQLQPRSRNPLPVNACLQQLIIQRLRETHTHIDSQQHRPYPPCRETGVMWCFPVSRRSKAETDTGTAQNSVFYLCAVLMQFYHRQTQKSHHKGLVLPSYPPPPLAPCNYQRAPTISLQENYIIESTMF